jgi:hypothetical protein
MKGRQPTTRPQESSAYTYDGKVECQFRRNFKHEELFGSNGKVLV